MRILTMCSPLRGNKIISRDQVPPDLIPSPDLQRTLPIVPSFAILGDTRDDTSHQGTKQLCCGHLNLSGVCLQTMIVSMASPLCIRLPLALDRVDLGGGN